MEETTIDFWADISWGVWNKGRDAWTSIYDKTFQELCGGDYVAAQWSLGTGTDKCGTWGSRVDPEIAAKIFYESCVAHPRNATRLANFREEQKMLDTVPYGIGFELCYGDKGYWMVMENRFAQKPTQKAIELARAKGFEVTRFGYIVKDGKRLRKVS